MTCEYLCYHVLYVIGNCSAGYYCPGGDSEPAPANTICTPGHFCPEGSATPTPCLVGSFSNTTGLTQASDCLPCTPGKAREARDRLYH